MRIVVTDTETDGVDAETCNLLEVAWTQVDSERLDWRDSVRQSLVQFGGEIGAEAKATHHITEDMVRDAPPADSVLALWRSFVDEGRPAAHNARYDSAVLRAAAPETAWICTYRCALHLYPDAPAHKNQVLRYWLGCEPPAYLLSGHAHRAAYDTVVTAEILRHMLREHSAEELAKLSVTPVRFKSFKFGKHRGTPIEKVDSGYLRWMLGQDYDEDVLFTARSELQERGYRA